MLLKKLEIQGFKSFADRTEILFTPGVIAVVGPNGSGKSNISDAILWVLGEQNVRALRGQKYEDVIFAGTDKRRPVGMAEVSSPLIILAESFQLIFPKLLSPDVHTDPEKASFLSTRLHAG